jgi:hypothetical protein
MNSKKTLLVPIFGQHWFHLGALAELIVKNREHYSKVKLLFMRDGLLLKPHQIHHHKIFRKFISAPEQILNEFLLYKGVDSELVYSRPEKEEKYNPVFFETFDQLRSFEKDNILVDGAEFTNVTRKEYNGTISYTVKLEQVKKSSGGWNSGQQKQVEKTTWPDFLSRSLEISRCSLKVL